MKTLLAALASVALLAGCGNGEPQRRNSDYYGANGGQGAGGAFNDSTSSSGSNGFGGDSGGGSGSSGGGGDSGGGGGGSSSSGLLSTADGRWSFEVASDSIVIFDRGLAFDAVAIPQGARELTIGLPDRAIEIDLGAAP